MRGGTREVWKGKVGVEKVTGSDERSDKLKAWRLGPGIRSEIR